MFINSDDVRRLGFYSYIDQGYNLDSLIDEAEYNYIRPVLTQPFLDQINSNPGNYPELIDTYLKPCLCFYTKYRYYSQIFVDGFYGSDGLVDSGNSHIALIDARYKFLVSIFKFAKAYELAMIDFIVQMNYPEYVAPDPPANPDPYPDPVPDPDPEPDPDPDPDPEPDPEPQPVETHKLLCGFYI